MAQAQVAAEQRNTTPEAEYKNLLRYEELRDSFRKIRYTYEGTFNGSISSILIPDETAYPATHDNILDIDSMWKRIEPTNGKDIAAWKRIDDQPTIEKLLLGWICRHNAQASDTPFASNIWQGNLSDPSFRQDILDGNIDHIDFEYPEMKEFLTVFSSQQFPTIDFKYSYQRFRSYIKKRRKSLRRLLPAATWVTIRLS